MKLSELRKRKPISQEVCGICGKSMSSADIQEAQNDNATHKGELVHSDCYYGQLSALVETRPIHTPGFPLSAK